MEMFQARFTCHGACGLQGVIVEVPCRKATEDVVVFVKRVTDAAAEKHRKLAPHCHRGEIDLMLPTNKDKNEGIGMSPAPIGDQIPDAMKSKGAN